MKSVDDSRTKTMLRSILLPFPDGTSLQSDVDRERVEMVTTPTSSLGLLQRNSYSRSLKIGIYYVLFGSLVLTAAAQRKRVFPNF